MAWGARLGDAAFHLDNGLQQVPTPLRLFAEKDGASVFLFLQQLPNRDIAPLFVRLRLPEDAHQVVARLFRLFGFLPRLLFPVQRDGGESRQADQRRQYNDQQARHGRPTFRPLDRTLHRSHRPRPDRFVRLVTPQVVGQLLGAGIAPRRLLAQALQADRLQIARDLRCQTRRRCRFLAHHADENDELRPLERRPARQALVQQRPQRINVRRRPRVAHLARRLLRRHVRRRPHDRPRLAHVPRLVVDALGQPEIRDLRRAVGREQDVSRLQIAMHHATQMGVVHRPRQRLNQLDRFSWRRTLLLQLLGERAAVAELQRKVRLPTHVADLMQLHDIRML